MTVDLALSIPKEVALARVMDLACPFCDREDLVSVAGHVARSHGVNRFELKDMLGVFYETPLCSKEMSERFAKRGRKMFAEGKTKFNSAPHTTHRLSKAAIALQKEKSAKLTVEIRAENGRKLSYRVAVKNAGRNAHILNLVESSDMTFEEIGDIFGLHSVTIKVVAKDLGYVEDGRARYNRSGRRSY